MVKMPHYDVVVVGGGPAGFVAATAAGREGARTLLAEQYGFLGGMATAGHLGPISPFHFNDEQVVEGIPQEFVERMVFSGGSTGHLKCTNPHGSGSYLCFYDRETYKSVALEMVLEAGVDVLFHTFFVDSVMNGSVLSGVWLASKSGMVRVDCTVVVDATGDADVAARCGVPVLHQPGVRGFTPQPGTLMFEMGGVDTRELKRYVDEHPEEFEWATECFPLRPYAKTINQSYFVAQGFENMVARAIQDGDLYLGRQTLLFLSTVHPGVMHFNSTRIASIDGTDVRSLSYAEIEGRRQVKSVARFITQKVPGFQNAYLLNTGVQVGIRESRHVQGEYTLTKEDVLEGRKHSDVIARGYFPIDIHSSNPKGYEEEGGGTWEPIKDAYDIPYRCLVPKMTEGLLVAGRAISATPEAHGSFRTQGGVMAIGQAAGTAAALSALSGVLPRALRVSLLQDHLRAGGASLERDTAKAEAQAKAADDAYWRAVKEGVVSEAESYKPRSAARRPRL